MQGWRIALVFFVEAQAQAALHRLVFEFTICPFWKYQVWTKTFQHCNILVKIYREKRLLCCEEEILRIKYCWGQTGRHMSKAGTNKDWWKSFYKFVSKIFLQLFSKIFWKLFSKIFWKLVSKIFLQFVSRIFLKIVSKRFLQLVSK